MPSSIPTRLRLAAADKAALAAYWDFYAPIAHEISADVRHSLAELPEWAPVVAAATPERVAADEARAFALQRAAIVDGDWAPYLADLNQQGGTYARMGISFLAWYDVIAIFREAIRRRLGELARRDLEQSMRVGEGLTRFIDLAMGHLGEAYLATKEQIISTQQLAIRTLSLPILQLGARTLIAPLVGAIDADRARRLAEALLAAIRDRRARGVVLDVTGVPEIDSATARHLAHACDAAQLMGARVVITGISAEIARALVALGAELPSARTVGDLQEALSELEYANAT